MKLRHAVILFTTLILLVFGVLGVTLITTTNMLQRQVNEIALAGESIRLYEELKSRLLIHNRNSFLYSLNRDPERLKSRGEQLAEITLLLEEILAAADSRNERETIYKLEAQVSDYFRSRDRINSMGMAPVEQYNAISEHVDSATNIIDDLISLNGAQMNQQLQDSRVRNVIADRSAFMLLAAAGVILLSIIAGIILTIARPLTALNEVIRDYRASGAPRRARIAGLREIREIASNFNMMADRLEEQIREQLRFVATIAHEFRNPLHSIGMAARVTLENRGEEDVEVQGTILRQVKYLDRLLQDLLDTARIEAGQFELEYSVQDVAALARDAVDLHKNWPIPHRFSVELPDQPLLCMCDEARISQVLTNLLSNAIKYSPARSTITVKAAADEELVILTVTDQGIGIDSGELESIFKPFRRTTATRGVYPGTGLGLSASRRIVESHGGRLEVESRLGAGSTFTVYLPIHSRKTYPREQAAPILADD